MFLFIFISAGITVVFYFYREQIKKALLIAHYEAIYWILGGAATVEDVIYASRNKIKELPNRANDVAIVTGGSRGIGFEVVKKLLQCNMHVIIGCRKVEAGVQAINLLRNEGIISGSAEVIKLDTSSLKAVLDFATQVQLKFKKLNLLINNAGIMFVPHSLTEDGIESHLSVNYLGHAYLTHLLLPLLKEAGKNSQYFSRIVNVSSCAHIPGKINFEDINYVKSTYISSQAYAQSKLAQLMFSNALDRRMKQEGAKVVSLAVHPGVVNTELFDGTLLKTVAPWFPKLFFKTPEQGSTTIVFCAISESLEGKGGIYLSNCRETWTNYAATDIAQQEKLMALTQNMLNIGDFCENTK